MFHPDKQEKKKKVKKSYFFNDFSLYGTKTWAKQFGRVKKSKGSFYKKLDKIYMEIKANEC